MSAPTPATHTPTPAPRQAGAARPMPALSRLLAPVSLLLSLGVLSACANPGQTPAAPSATAWFAPAPIAAAVPPASAPAQPASAAADSDRTVAEPIIIRGNDRLIAPPSIPANPPVRGASTSLKFESAPAAEVVKVVLGDLLKVDYIVHPPLSGAITLTTRQAVSPDRALLLLESALQANGIVMARDTRGTYHVGTPESLKGIVTAPVVAEPGKPLPPGYGTIVVPLEYLGATEMANILRPLISGDAIVRVDTLRNFLILRGTRAEAEGWLDLVKTFDVNLLRGMSVGVFPLKYTSAAEVDNALRLLSGGAAAAAGAGAGATGQTAGVAPRSQAARPGAATAPGAAGAAGAPALQGLGENSPLFGALRVIPIERINAVMVITPRAAYLDEARYWIERFDQPNLNSTEPQLFVYKVQNGSADHLAELLNGIYGATQSTTGFSGQTGLAPGLTGAGGYSNVNNSFAGQFGGNSTSSSPFGSGGLGGGGFGGIGGGFGGIGGGIGGGFGGIGGGGLGNRGFGQGALGQTGAPTGPNVVTTTLAGNVRVMADRINNTLLIHASAPEYQRIAATLKRLDIQRAQVLIEASIVEVTLGDGLQYGLQWAFNSNFGRFAGSGVLGNPNPPSGAAVAQASNAFTYTLINGANIAAVLGALANKSLVKVMSSPSLMVLDNHTAAFQVGDQVPINTGTTQSGAVTPYITTNIQYKDTGVMLGVTPSVSAGDLVTLTINQQVTNIGPDSSSAATAGYPTFMQRQINSKVAVRSGETLVLGGLIRDSDSSGKSGLPILSAIPVIGALFGTHTQSTARTELLVILTPRVLRSDDDARAVSRELRDRMQGLLSGGALPPLR